MRITPYVQDEELILRHSRIQYSARASIFGCCSRKFIIIRNKASHSMGCGISKDRGAQKLWRSGSFHREGWTYGSQPRRLEDWQLFPDADRSALSTDR